MCLPTLRTCDRQYRVDYLPDKRHGNHIRRLTPLFIYMKSLGNVSETASGELIQPFGLARRDKCPCSFLGARSFCELFAALMQYARLSGISLSE